MLITKLTATNNKNSKWIAQAILLNSTTTFERETNQQFVNFQDFG